MSLPPPPDSMLAAMRTMHKMLRGERSPAETAADLGGAPVDRLAVYRDFVRGHIDGILAKSFRGLRGRFDCAGWHALTAAYFEEVPAASYELNRASEAFPGWLAARIEAGAVDLSPFYVELCRLEWAEFEAYSDPAPLPDPAALDAPVLNPTLRVLNLRYPAAEFLARTRRGEDPGEPPGPFPGGPQVVFVFREPAGLRHRYQTATDPLLFAFKMTHDGLDVTAAAAASGASPAQIEDALAEAEDLGLIFRPAESRGPGA